MLAVGTGRTTTEEWDQLMFIEFHGAADQVTGSLHRVHVCGQDILLDCGLFQGRRAESNWKNRELPKWALGAHCVILSHAHLDHSGNIPTLVKRGFQGNIFATPATRDLCSVMWRDAGMIHEQDARYLNRKYEREGVNERITPLYTIEDAQTATERLFSIPFHRRFEVAKGVTLTFHNSGHVLGSALVELELEENGRTVRLLFTGDVGREELPLMQTPEIVSGVDALLIESTYGNREHEDIRELDQQLGNIVRRTISRGGRVYIPTFALERAQEVLFALDRLHEAGDVPNVPIYIDSPLAVAITEIYKLHPESLDTHVRERLSSSRNPFSPPGLTYVGNVEESRTLQNSQEPCIIMAGSGMCEGGRILFHFTKALSQARNSIVLVGFMAQHTLGRRIQERRSAVKVLGVERELHAEVHALGGLSAHADASDLVKFVRSTARAGNLRHVFLVHGETEAREALARRLEGDVNVRATLPVVGTKVVL